MKRLSKVSRDIIQKFLVSFSIKNLVLITAACLLLPNLANAQISTLVKDGFVGGTSINGGSVNDGDVINFVVDVEFEYDLTTILSITNPTSEPSATVTLTDTMTGSLTYENMLELPLGWEPAVPVPTNGTTLNNVRLASWTTPPTPTTDIAQDLPALETTIELVYGENAFRAQAKVIAQTIDLHDVASNGDGYFPLRFTFPNGDLAMVVVNS